MARRSVANCDICEKLGEYIYIKNDVGEKLPEAAGMLKEVAGEVLGAVVYKCPHCGTFYTYSRETDNEPGLSFDVTEMKRVGRDEAKKIIDSEKRYAKKYKQKKLKELEKSISTLEASERSVVLYLVETLGKGKCQPVIENDLNIGGPEAGAIFASLVKKGILEKKIVYPLKAEKDECRQESERYTKDNVFFNIKPVI